MPYSLLADLILIVHFIFILFVICGGILAFKNIRWAWLHVPIFLWGSIVNLMGWVCPLTPLEVELRLRAGESIFQQGFIEHYIGNAIYPNGMGPRAGLILGLSALGWNLLIYAVLLRKRRHTSIL